MAPAKKAEEAVKETFDHTRDLATMTEKELRDELHALEAKIIEAGDKLTPALGRRFDAIDKALGELAHFHTRFGQRH